MILIILIVSHYHYLQNSLKVQSNEIIPIFIIIKLVTIIKVIMIRQITMIHVIIIIINVNLSG